MFAPARGVRGRHLLTHARLGLRLLELTDARAADRVPVSDAGSACSQEYICLYGDCKLTYYMDTFKTHTGCHTTADDVVDVVHRGGPAVLEHTPMLAATWLLRISNAPAIHASMCRIFTRCSV